ncbi:transposase [Gracilibacillus sp. YIM 98692]|uniref:transposase n=1 Tax=Gracilibacillus sp. YIM 98692 TaxID=2663532 RepID=UPI001F09E3CB|nr:transposase [Gracilibacillus sp. YIM 98692]
MDFSQVKPLSDEVFTDVMKGESRKADIVMEVKLKGRDTLIIIHVEPQSYPQQNFHQRMYHYFSLLYNKYRKPILPIALFTYDQIREEPNQFSMSFPFFHVLSFLTFELKKQNWRKYLKSQNPVAAALLSKMRYNESERIQVKKEFLRMLVTMQVDPAKMYLVNGFFETYLPLSEQEEVQLMKEMHEFKPEELEFINQLPNSWRDKGLKEGREKGLKEGRKEGVKQGIKQGKEQGIEQGIKQGKKEGTQKTQEQIAKQMMREGLSLDMIERVTKVEMDKLESWKKEL